MRAHLGQQEMPKREYRRSRDKKRVNPRHESPHQKEARTVIRVSLGAAKPTLLLVYTDTRRSYLLFSCYFTEGERE